MIGRTISHYKILEKLGEGGMGVVFKAHDFERNGPAVLKFLHTRELKNDTIKARFFREARTAGSLDHPNICTVSEIVEEEDLIFLAMPWVEGESLRHRMTMGAMRFAQALDIAVQIARGLEAAHANGIIHRDIKGDNILITPGGCGQDPRFRIGEGGGGDGDHAVEHDGGNRGVRLARARAGTEGRREDRHLVLGGLSLRDDRGAAPVSG